MRKKKTRKTVLDKVIPYQLYAVGLRTEPAPLVRGSSRRITIMRFRPANIRVINRRNSRLDRDLRCLLRKDGKKKENKEEEKTKKVLDKVIPYQCCIVERGELAVRAANSGGAAIRGDTSTSPVQTRFAIQRESFLFYLLLACKKIP